MLIYVNVTDGQTNTPKVKFGILQTYQTYQKNFTK